MNTDDHDDDDRWVTFSRIRLGRATLLVQRHPDGRARTIPTR